MNRVLVGRVLPWMLVAPTCWVAYRLFLRTGQLLLRIDDLEQQLQELGAVRTSGGRLRPGLPVGSVLHDFELPDLSGSRMTLSQWRGRRVLLIFFDPHCSFSRALLPHLAALPPDPSDGRPVPLIISTGDAQENRDLFMAHGIRLPVLLQEYREVASLYRVGGTPAGYLVDEHRRTASQLAVGTHSLLALVGAAMDDVGHDASVDDGDYTPHRGTDPLGGSRLNRSGLALGTPAPSFCLPRLEGGQLCLEEYRGRRVLLVFSDPACEPCDELAPALERLHRGSPDIRVLMVSRGDPEANRQKVSEHGLTLPIVLQRHWEISHDYGMFATPIGYLIDEQGVIAADVAVGQKAILALVAGLPAQRKRKEAVPMA